MASLGAAANSLSVTDVERGLSRPHSIPSHGTWDTTAAMNAVTTSSTRTASRADQRTLAGRWRSTTVSFRSSSICLANRRSRGVRTTSQWTRTKSCGTTRMATITAIPTRAVTSTPSAFRWSRTTGPAASSRSSVYVSSWTVTVAATSGNSAPPFSLANTALVRSPSGSTAVMPCPAALSSMLSATLRRAPMLRSRPCHRAPWTTYARSRRRTTGTSTAPRKPSKARTTSAGCTTHTTTASAAMPMMAGASLRSSVRARVVISRITRTLSDPLRPGA
jgi:hypothetical protein